jgi:hypothetical protein
MSQHYAQNRGECKAREPTNKKHTATFEQSAIQNAQEQQMPGTVKLCSLFVTILVRGE